MRALASFHGVAVLCALLVLAAYAVVGVAVAIALDERRPAAQDDPTGPTADKTA